MLGIGLRRHLLMSMSQQLWAYPSVSRERLYIYLVTLRVTARAQPHRAADKQITGAYSTLEFCCSGSVV
jgi:hypothetical protein